MAEAQFNPSTLKASFDSATKKQQVINMGCEHCPGGTSPETIKVTASGILCCPGVGNCCSSVGDDKIKITSMGIGWNGVSVLQRGWYPWMNWNSDTGKWSGAEEGSLCVWSELIYDDFGYAEHYNLANCQGGVDSYIQYVAKLVQFIRTNTQWQLGIMLGGVGTAPSWPDHPFQRSESGGPFEYCIPYDLELENDYECPSDCIGNGTAIITEV